MANPDQDRIPKGKGGGGRWTKAGNMAAAAASGKLTEEEYNRIMDEKYQKKLNEENVEFKREVKAAKLAAGVPDKERTGAAPVFSGGYENAEVLKQIRAGDKVDFGDKGKYYVQGWKKDYFLVTKKSSERWVEDPIAMNLQGAIHFSDAKKIIEKGS